MKQIIEKVKENITITNIIAAVVAAMVVVDVLYITGLSSMLFDVKYSIKEYFAYMFRIVGDFIFFGMVLYNRKMEQLSDRIDALKWKRAECKSDEGLELYVREIEDKTRQYIVNANKFTTHRLYALYTAMVVMLAGEAIYSLIAGLEFPFNSLLFYTLLYFIISTSRSLVLSVSTRLQNSIND